MPSTSRKPKRTAKKAAKARRRNMSVGVDQDVDGCDCNFLESEITPNSALPAAKGGVGMLARRRRR